MIDVFPLTPESAAPGYRRHRAEFRTREGTRLLRVMTPEHASPLSEDWLLPPALVLGMRRAEPVRIHGTVSPMLIAAVDRIQEMLQANAEPRRPLHPVALTATKVSPRSPRRGAKTIGAFSAGLDAFYTALELDEQLDALLYVHGYEAAPEDEAQLFLLLPQIKAAARDLHKPLWLVDSDHWDLVWRGGGRTVDSGLAMLIMIGLLMGSDVRKIVLPASYSQAYEDAHWASLSNFLPLWRTEHFEVEQHGTVSRTEKLALVTRSEIAMQRLRVCWARWGKAYNCGHCWKCVRTLVNLELAGATGRCRTLPSTLDLERVVRLPLDAQGRSTLVREYLAEAEAQGRDDLAAALRSRIVGAPPAPPSPWARLLSRMGKPLRERPLRRQRRRTRRALDAHRRAHGSAHLFVNLDAAD